MRYSQKIYDHGNTRTKIVENIQLDNGKRISIFKYMHGEVMTEKLSCLRDQFGNWVRSCLKFYGSDSKPFKIMNSSAKDFK